MLQAMHPVHILLKELGCGNIREAAKMLATRLRSLPQQSFPNCSEALRPLTLGDLKTICARQGVRSYEFNASLPSEGQLVPLRDGGFHVRVARGSDTTKARFTVAHEIGHTFFYDQRSVPPKRVVEAVQPPARMLLQHSSIEFEEAFCDAFASELLFPEDSAKAALKSTVGITDPSRFLISAEHVSANWGVSVPTTLSRLNDTSGFPGNLLAVVFRKRPHIKSGQNPALRVVLSFPRPSCGWFVPANKRAASIGFTGADALYSWWEEFPQRVPNQKYRRSGIFSFEVVNGNSAVLENQTGVASACTETLHMWSKGSPGTRWKLITLHTQVVYRMYAVSTAEVYCLAIVSTDSQSHHNSQPPSSTLE